MLFHKLTNHVTKDGANGVESFVSSTNVVQTTVVEENLLNDEDGNCLAQFRAGLHYPETEGNDLRRQEEVDDLGGVVLDKCSDNAQGSQPQVFEWS